MTLVNANIRANGTTDLARRLKAARVLAGIDQQAIAAMLGVSRSAVGMWEQGRTEPNATHFVKWADICQVELTWLAEGINKTAPTVVRAVPVRPEGFEPPTFCFGVSLPEAMAVFALILAKNAGLLVSQN